MEHSGSYAIPLALVYPSTRCACRDAAGILTTVLEEIEGLMEVNAGR
jgi:hypothetical protein